MHFLNSLISNSQKFEKPFTHWELNKPLTNGAVEEIVNADIADPAKYQINYELRR